MNTPINNLFKEVCIIIGVAIILALGLNIDFSKWDITLGIPAKRIAWLRIPPQSKPLSDSELTSLLSNTTTNDSIAVYQPMKDSVKTSKLHLQDSLAKTLHSNDSLVTRNNALVDSIKTAKRKLRDSLIAIKKQGLPSKNNSEPNDPPSFDGVPREIDYDQFVKMRSVGVKVFDARKNDDFDKGHIPSAILVDVQNFEPTYVPRVITLPKNKPVIIYCSGGQCELSHDLAKRLFEFGFKYVFIYTGGWEDWTKRGQDVEK